MNKNISSLDVVDWNQISKVTFQDVAPESLVSELVAESLLKLDLPRNTPYGAVVDGRSLNGNESLASAGIGENSEVMLTPRVVAGQV